MPSTYSNLKFELIGTGDQAGNWGDTTNSNIGTAIEQAITGLGNPVFTADSNLTISLTDTTALQVARALVLNVTSSVSLTATRQLIVPAIQKQYIVQNNTTGGQSITVITAFGTGVTVPNGAKIILYGDGVDVTNAVSHFSALTLAAPLPITSGGTGSTTAGLASGNSIVLSGTFPNQTINLYGYVQNSQSADYTLVLGDAGKQIFHPASDASQRNYTIPADSAVSFPIGTQVLFTVENGGRAVFVSCGDTLVFGAGTTGTVQVVPNNTLVCIKVTATKWMANFLYQTGSVSTVLESVVVAGSSMVTYPWTSTGFGTAYTNASGVPASVLGAAFSPSGRDLAIAHAVTPFVTVYPFSVQGYGAKYSDPATLPVTQGNGVVFSNLGDNIAVACSGTPFVSVYPWSGAGFGSKYANPATLPAGIGSSVAFSPSDDAIAVAHATTPFVSVYPWSGAGFGTKFTNPATLPTGTGNSVAFSPSGGAIAVAHATTPFVSAYPWSGAGFGTKYANPATVPTGTGRGVAFNPAGTAIAVAHDITPWVSTYPWSGAGFGTRFANPATVPTGIGNAVDFNPAGTAIAVGHAVTPFVSAYPWSGAGFGVKYANPGSLPAAAVNSVAFTVNP